jgi:SAM-dependent methyltransferase
VRIERVHGRRLFGADPAAYDEARPDYPEAVFEVLERRCGLRPGTRVLEIGAGTGKATRRLLERRARVVAIEPDDALAAYLASHVVEVEVRIEPFEEIRLGERRFDLAVAATSFHWIEPSVGLPKVFGLLRPGGWWAMWWNVFGDEDGRTPFMQATHHLFEPLAQSPSSGLDGRPSFALDAEQRLVDLEAAGFADAERELVDWRLTLDTARLRRLYATYSPIASLDEAQRTALLDEVVRIASEQFGGTVEHPARTVLYTARRPG